MEIVRKSEHGYEGARQIANARFNYMPSVICYCENPGDVQEALRMAKHEKLRVRVRSGGHQHEGMCSGAFINFPDKDLVEGPDTPERRKRLLRFYYAGNLGELIAVKRAWDPKNILDFEMGIPTS